MNDHTGRRVTDYAKRKAFFRKALAPPGCPLVMGIGVPPKPDPA
jgi:hypothetical protein